MQVRAARHTTVPRFSVGDRQKEFIEPSLQEAEFVMRAAVEANITWTVTTSLTAAVGFLQTLTNTATKLRTCPNGSPQTGIWVTDMKNRVDGDQRLVLFLASGPTHNGSVGQNNHAMRASVPTRLTEVRNHLVNIRVENKPKMFAGDAHEWKGFELDLQPEIDIRDVKQLASKMCNVLPEHMRVLYKDRQLRNEEIVAECGLDGDEPLKILNTAGHAAIVEGSRPSEKKRAGHEPSVNVISEAGGIFAPISGPMECCDDEATREEEEFYGYHRLQREGISQADRGTSELSTFGVVAADEATVEPSSRDHTCRICPHSGQVQNDGIESSDLFTISTDKILAKPSDTPVLNRSDTYTYAWHQDEKHLRVSKFQIVATTWINETQRRTARCALDVLKSHDANRFVADVSVGRYVPVRPATGLFWLMHVRRGSFTIHERQLDKLEQASCETTDTPVRGTTSIDRGVVLTPLPPKFAGVKTNNWIQPTTSVELEQHGRRRWNCRTGTAKMSNSCPPRGGMIPL